MATGLLNLDAWLAQPGFPAGAAAASPAPALTAAAFLSVLDDYLGAGPPSEQPADEPDHAAAPQLYVPVFCPAPLTVAATPASGEAPAAGATPAIETVATAGTPAPSQSGPPESGPQVEKPATGLPAVAPTASVEVAPDEVAPDDVAPDEVAPDDVAPEPKKEPHREEAAGEDTAPQPLPAQPAAAGLTPPAPEPVPGSAASPQTREPAPSMESFVKGGEATRSVPADRLADVATAPAARTAGSTPGIAFAVRLTDQATAEAPAESATRPTPAAEAPAATPAVEAAQPARAAEVRAVEPGLAGGPQPPAESVATTPETETPTPVEAAARQDAPAAAPRAEAGAAPRTPAMTWNPAAPAAAPAPPKSAVPREPALRDATVRTGEKSAPGPLPPPEAEAGAEPYSPQSEPTSRLSPQAARESIASGPVRRIETVTPGAAGSVPAVEPAAHAKAAAPESEGPPAARPESGAKAAPAQRVPAPSATPDTGDTAKAEQPRTSGEKHAAARDAHPAAPVAAAPHRAQASDAPGAPAPKAPAQPATADAPELKSRPPEPVRDIALKVSGQEQRIEIRMAERAGEIRVSVHAPEGQLRQDLQEHLPELVRDLDRQGFAAETWRPAEPAARSDTAGSGTHEPPGRGAGQGNPQQDGRGRRNRPQPEWLEEMVRRIAAEPERNAWQQ